jgi:hypothetical protein
LIDWLRHRVVHSVPNNNSPCLRSRFETQQRAKTTGRIVPRDVLLKSMDQVPKAMKILSRDVDLFLEIENAGQNDLVTAVPR